MSLSNTNSEAMRQGQAAVGADVSPTQSREDEIRTGVSENNTAPSFIEHDAKKLLDKAIQNYQTITGRTLYDGQVEMYLLEVIAYMLSLRAYQEQSSFENNLALFAEGKYLDQIGANVSTYRLDGEDDTRFRKRILSAHERISKAGPRAGYHSLVMASNPNITDVAIIRSSPGHIDIYPLMLTGKPTKDEMAAILKALDPEHDIPMGDYVEIKAPIAFDFKINIQIKSSTDPKLIERLAYEKLKSITDEWRLKLSQHLAPSILISAVKSIDGVIDADETSLKFEEIAESQYLNCTEINLNVNLVQG